MLTLVCIMTGHGTRFHPHLKAHWGGLYHFAMIIGSFLGRMTSMAPDSSRIGYASQIFAVLVGVCETWGSLEGSRGWG